MEGEIDVAVAAYPVLGLGLCAVLGDRGYSTACVEHPADLVRLLPQLRPRVVLIDVVLPGGQAAVEVALDAACRPAVLVMGDDAEDDELLLAAACAGAIGVLPRDVSPDAADRCIDAALRGESALPRHLVPRVVATLRAQVSAVHEPSHGPVLTGRERQVLDMMRAGLSTRTIAERLVVAPVTVRTHVCAIRRKLGAESAPPIQLPTQRVGSAKRLDGLAGLRIS